METLADSRLSKPPAPPIVATELKGGKMFGETKYWYVRANCDGRPVILGPYTSNEEASQAGYSQLDGDFDTVELPTRDLGKAVRMLRVNSLNEGNSLQQAMMRTKHSL